MKNLLPKKRSYCKKLGHVHLSSRSYIVQHLLEERAKILQSKQMALMYLQEKALEVKEKLTNDLMLYGLWQSKSDIQDGLAKLKTKTEKLTALKTQLSFRSKVLEQKYPEKDVFFLSKNKKKLSVDEVTQNLIKLLTPPPSSDAANQETLVGKRIGKSLMDRNSGTMVKF